MTNVGGWAELGATPPVPPFPPLSAGLAALGAGGGNSADAELRAGSCFMSKLLRQNKRDHSHFVLLCIHRALTVAEIFLA